MLISQRIFASDFKFESYIPNQVYKQKHDMYLDFKKSGWKNSSENERLVEELNRTERPLWFQLGPGDKVYAKTLEKRVLVYNFAEKAVKVGCFPKFLEGSLLHVMPSGKLIALSDERVVLLNERDLSEEKTLESPVSGLSSRFLSLSKTQVLEKPIAARALYLWNFAGKDPACQPLKQLKLGARDIYDFALLPDKRVVLLLRDGLYVWDHKQAAEISDFSSLQKIWKTRKVIRRVYVSPQGYVVCTMSTGELIYLDSKVIVKPVRWKYQVPTKTLPNNKEKHTKAYYQGVVFLSQNRMMTLVDESELHENNALLKCYIWDLNKVPGMPGFIQELPCNIRRETPFLATLKTKLVVGDFNDTLHIVTH